MVDSIILADKDSFSWDFSKRIEEKIRGKLYRNSKLPENNHRIKLSNVGISYFNDGEVGVNIPVNVRGKHVFFIHDSSKNPSEWLTQLSMVNDALYRASAEKIIDVLPYLKYSRQDRRDKPRVPISSKVVAEIISMKANKLIVSDLHSKQIEGFYSIPVDVIESYPTFCENLSNRYDLEKIVLVSPDVGGTKNLAESLKLLESKFLKNKEKKISFAIGDKRRIGKTIEQINIIGDVEGKDAVVVDDIIDTGGTLLKLAEVLREKRVNSLSVYSTHAVFSNDAEGKILESYDNVFVTDTIPRKLDKKTKLISLDNVFAEAIYKIINNESLSEMFHKR